MHSDLLDSVAVFLRRYVVLTDEQADAVALFVAHTHTFDAAEATGYLAITSAEKRSGKTRLLEVLEMLFCRPWLTGRVTAAVLVRKIDKLCPTLLLDETDAAFKGPEESREALRGTLNSGYRRGGRTSLCVGTGASITFRDFQTFCPKAIAGIGQLPDTGADRSIPIRLKRRASHERVERFRRRDVDAEARPIRENLVQVGVDAIETLRDARPELPGELDDRAADCWEPLFAIADLAGGDWPARARRAARTLSSHGREDDSLGVKLLGDIYDVFERLAQTRISKRQIVAELLALDEAPWGDLRGRPLDGRQLGRLLRPFRISSRTVRIPGADTVNGFQREQFEDAWRRYLRWQPSRRSHLAPEAADPRFNLGLRRTM
jgi:hypothetical protein